MPLTEGPVTLLVVDDEEPIRNAVRKFLVQQGYEVATAATGEEALEVLQRQKITGMLLDVNLPGHQRHRPGAPDPRAGAQRSRSSCSPRSTTPPAPRSACSAARSTTSSSRSTWPISAAPSSRALERRHTPLESQQINQWLKEEVALRVAERRLEQANQERLSVATLEALVNALEAKDPYLRGPLRAGRRPLRLRRGASWRAATR